jgi:putative membrane protein
MAQERNTMEEHMLSNTDLAFERTVLAENRTLMAWIRTAISLISFGFTIYKIFQETGKSPEAAQRLLTPRAVGMLMIALALLGLFWGIREYDAVIKKLKKSNPGIEQSKTLWLAVLVFLFGLMLFLGVLFRQ